MWSFWHKESDIPGLGSSSFSCTSTDGISAALGRVLNASNASEVWDALSKHPGCDDNDDNEEADGNDANGWPNESFPDDDDNDDIDEADGWPSDKIFEHDKLLSEVDNNGSSRKYAGCTSQSDVGVWDNVLREMDKRGVGNDNDDDSGLHDNTEGFCGVVFKASDSDCDPTWPERLLRGTESTECWDDVWKRLSDDDISAEPDNSFPGCDKLPRGADNKDLFANDIAGSVDGWFKLLV